MSGPPPPEPPRHEEGETWMELGAETLKVSKRVRRTLVRAVRSASTRDVLVEEDLARDEVIVERVPINRVVETMPPVRQEGDTTVVPVVSEELVLVRRLVLKEEVRLRQVRAVERFTEVVTLREQQVAVTRTDLDEEPGPHPAEPGKQSPTQPATRKDAP